MIDLYSILESKPNNKLYLKRYIRFIEACAQKNQILIETQYTEKHHICPKSKDMFPEYASFKDFPWNCVILTYRQHIIAHILLLKTFNTQSQALSVLRTSGQIHAKNHNLRSVNTRLIESAKKVLSDQRKGKFTRGYNPDGTPRVKNSTKELLSSLKTKYYSDPNNRKKQSKACSGKPKKDTSKLSEYAKNRSTEHTKNLSDGVKDHWATISTQDRKIKRMHGIYITPIGNFTHIPRYGSYCKNNLTRFSSHNLKKNPYLNSSVKGMTPKELGFDFIPKNDPRLAQYYDGLNQAHQPEPSHPLASELNDFLSLEKLLP